LATPQYVRNFIPFTCVILSKFSLFGKRFYTLLSTFFFFSSKKVETSLFSAELFLYDNGKAI